MKLGAFSISLTVKDLGVSQAFYTDLGFAAFAGDPAQGWCMMRNGQTVIGLFCGMFDKNMLTFNPGWDQDAQPVDPFEDVRALQAELRAKGVSFLQEADEATNGPASFMIMDPDGNPILIDQHRD